MFQDLFLSFRFLNCIPKLIANTLNQEKLHLNCVLFNPQSVTASDDLGKRHDCKIVYDICVNILAPVTDRCGKTVNSCALSVFLDYLTHKCVIGRMCQGELVLLKVNRFQ